MDHTRVLDLEIQTTKNNVFTISSLFLDCKVHTYVNLADTRYISRSKGQLNCNKTHQLDVHEAPQDSDYDSVFDISQQVGDIGVRVAGHETSDDSDYDTVQLDDTDHDHNCIPGVCGTKKEDASMSLKDIADDLGIITGSFSFFE